MSIADENVSMETHLQPPETNKTVTMATIKPHGHQLPGNQQQETREKRIKPARVPFSDKVEFVSEMTTQLTNRADYNPESTAVILSMTAQFLLDLYEWQDKTKESHVSIMNRYDYTVFNKIRVMV